MIAYRSREISQRRALGWDRRSMPVLVLGRASTFMLASAELDAAIALRRLVI